MLTQQRNALALAALLAVTTVTGGALVTVLNSPQPAPKQPAISPAVITVPQAATPQLAAARPAPAPVESHEPDGGDS